MRLVNILIINDLRYGLNRIAKGAELQRVSADIACPYRLFGKAKWAEWWRKRIVIL